ncbi:MAG: chalcone isomerase family protein [Planctomycetes bacterium]|nr:chalcone isomerase family protein [Planctomycetota bacterium]
MRYLLLLALTFFIFTPTASAVQDVLPIPDPQQEEAPQIEEKATDAMFPTWIKHGKGDSAKTHHLAGMGVRKKTVFRVKVYAFGFYLDSSAAAKIIQPLVGRKMKVMMKDGALEKALLDDSYGKTLRLVMARTVDAEDMAEAFDESLKLRIKDSTAKLSDEEKKAANKALTKFRGYFKDPAKEGQVLEFSWLPSGRLLTTIDGKVLPEIKNFALCHALFHIYVGNDPISESGKEAILNGLPAALKVGQAKKQ